MCHKSVLHLYYLYLPDPFHCAEDKRVKARKENRNGWRCGKRKRSGRDGSGREGRNKKDKEQTERSKSEKQGSGRGIEIWGRKGKGIKKGDKQEREGNGRGREKREGRRKQSKGVGKRHK